MNSREITKKIEEMKNKEAALKAEIDEDNQKLTEIRHQIVLYTRWNKKVQKIEADAEKKLQSVEAEFRKEQNPDHEVKQEPADHAEGY